MSGGKNPYLAVVGPGSHLGGAQDVEPEASRGAASAAEKSNFSGIAVPLLNRAKARRIAEQDGTILLLGESGTGKSTLARELHGASPRRHGRLVQRGCGGFDGGTLIDQLFGHTEGSFTGASATRRGLLEVADGGTLVLDDIGYLPRAAQAALLQFLDDGTYSPIGGEGKDCRADVRLIVTTNRDLDQLADQGEFLPDLLNRLRHWCIWLPPLREQPQRIRELARTFLAAHAEGGAGGADGGSWILSEEALDLLCSLPWPGNLRQLRYAVENLALCAGDGPGPLTATTVARILLDNGANPAASAPALDRQSLDKRIRHLLSVTRGNVAMTSRILGCSRTTIYARIKANGWQLPR